MASWAPVQGSSLAPLNLEVLGREVGRRLHIRIEAGHTEEGVLTMCENRAESREDVKAQAKAHWHLHIKKKKPLDWGRL